jgi:uncharacterized protein YndB with AHSA1/START domain
VVPSGTEVVEHEIRIEAQPETVFSFFTDPARMVQWMGAEATLDPRPGGTCRIAFHTSPTLSALLDPNFGPGHQERLRPDPRVRVMMGEFVDVDPPSRISFTWGWERDLYEVPPQSTEVDVSFTPDGAGTVVRLVHRRIPTVAVPLHTAGWGHYLPRLAAVAAGQDPGPDPWQADAPQAERA